MSIKKKGRIDYHGRTNNNFRNRKFKCPTENFIISREITFYSKRKKRTEEKKK